MALTRMRIIAGDDRLKSRVEDTAQRVLAKSRDPDAVKQDIYDMRKRLAAEKPGRTLWELKTAPGGLIDIEFIAQQSLLLRGSDALQPNIAAALESLAHSQDLAPQHADILITELRDLQSLQQVLRLAVGVNFDPETASIGLKSRLARAVGAASFTEASDRLAEGKRRAADIRCKKIGPIATDREGRARYTDIR